MSLLNPQLQAFLAITKYKTVHGAAQKLHLTQTAVTQRIQALEKSLATSLFIRSRRGMLLTAEGEALLHYCLASRELETAVIARIKGHGIETPVNICITGPTSIISSRIIPACIPILKQFPNLLIQFEINDQENRARSLRNDSSQFAIIHESELSKELQYKKLKSEEYVLVCANSWQHRPLTEILNQERIIDFNPSDQMTFNYLQYYNLNQNLRGERHFVNHTESIAQMIAQGLGFGVLTKEFATPYVQNQQLMILNNSQIYQNNMILAWYHRPEPPAYFQAIIDNIN